MIKTKSRDCGSDNGLITAIYLFYIRCTQSASKEREMNGEVHKTTQSKIQQNMRHKTSTEINEKVL